MHGLFLLWQYMQPKCVTCTFISLHINFGESIIDKIHYTIAINVIVPWSVMTDLVYLFGVAGELVWQWPFYGSKSVGTVLIHLINSFGMTFQLQHHFHRFDIALPQLSTYHCKLIVCISHQLPREQFVEISFDIPVYLKQLNEAFFHICFW